MNNDFLKIKVPLIIYLFILLFLPPIVKDINILIFISCFSSIVIILKYLKKAIKLIFSKGIMSILAILIIYYLWYFIVVLGNNLFNSHPFNLYNFLITSYSMFLVVPLIFICIIHILIYTREKQIEFYEIVECIIYAGLIQAFIAILCFILPPFKTFLINIMYYNTGDKLFLNQYYLERRFFGFSNNLLDSYGYGTGILAVIPLFHSIKNGKKWLITVPFLLMIPLLNSRTGLVIFATGFIIWICYLIKSNEIANYYKILGWLMVCFGVIVFIVSIFYPAIINWILNDFLSFLNISSGTANVLFSKNFWRLPSLIGIIFGLGVTIAGYGKLGPILHFTSDVGYINEIWKTGIIGLLILLYLLFKLEKQNIENIKKDYKYFVIFLLISTLIANVKFYVFSCGSGMVLIMLFYVITLPNEQLIKLKTKNKNPKKKISIIIPIYNVADYLQRCLDSVVNQTYKNIEIILVNDGSPDNSEEICKLYFNDKRVKYIKQKNAGLSAARNTGIENASGDYLVFIDSDDYVNIHFIESLYNTISTTNADMAICNYKKVFDGNHDINEKSNNNEILILDNDLKYQNLYNDKKTIMTVAWNKIYDKKMFNNIRYPNGKYHEDEYIVCELFKKAKKIAYIDNKYYYYYQRENSITGKYNLKNYDVLEAFHRKLQFFENIDEKELYGKALYDYYYQLIYQRKMLEKNFSGKDDLVSEINSNIKKYRKNFILDFNIPFLKKIKILFMVLNIL